MCLFGDDLTIAASYLRKLADDLEMIAAGSGPTDDQLAHAPVISGWRPEMTDRNDAAVSGFVSGDRFFGDGEKVNIEIVAADPDCAWVRSLLGWYRLGPSADELEECGHA